MEDFFFNAFASISIASSLLMISRKNPVHSALFLVLTLLSMAGLFLLLAAPFVAVIQVLVYTGAIMVLMVFVIMLLNLQSDQLHLGFPSFGKWLALVLIVLFGVHFSDAMRIAPGSGKVVLEAFGFYADKGVPPTPPPLGFGSSIDVGKLLFTKYLLVFELTSILLLSAMVGVIVIGRRKTPDLEASDLDELNPDPKLRLREDDE